MRTSKSAVFLFELMIIILVFTLAAAICTQIFAQSFVTSTTSHELTMSSINAQTVAEQFKAGADDIDPLYFDEDWQKTDAAGAVYTVSLEGQAGSPGMRDAYVAVSKAGGGESIFSLHVKEFVG
ncbi:MAG: hypothetical protein LBS85_04145 [Clostridiales Family XIII bacterium]|jgi:hypothetical protein|nr:hypothetical protein [Clostridiales Family XIII bacterium]